MFFRGFKIINKLSYWLVVGSIGCHCWRHRRSSAERSARGSGSRATSAEWSAASSGSRPARRPAATWGARGPGAAERYRLATGSATWRTAGPRPTEQSAHCPRRRCYHSSLSRPLSLISHSTTLCWRCPRNRVPLLGKARSTFPAWFSHCWSALRSIRLTIRSTAQEGTTGCIYLQTKS